MNSKTKKLVPFFSSSLSAPWHMEFQGWRAREPDPSCGNAASFNPLCQSRIDPVTWHCRDAADPIVAQWELPSLVSVTDVWFNSIVLENYV